MSNKEDLFYRCIPRFITHNRDLPAYSRYLFMVIVQELNLDTGKAQITTEYIAKVSGLSEKTVQRYLPYLEKKGYIRVERAPKGSKIPNVYEIIGVAALAVIVNTKLLRDETLRRSRI